MEVEDDVARHQLSKLHIWSLQREVSGKPVHYSVLGWNVQGWGVAGDVV